MVQIGVVGSIAKSFLIFTVVVGVSLILLLIATDQIPFALLLLIGLTIPFSAIALEYRKNFKKFECRNCNNEFKVSYLRLVFTLNFRGKDPAPTGTAAYNLKCPKCGNEAWLVPLEE